MPEEKLPVVHIKQKYTPSLYNDPTLSQRIRKHFEIRLGKEQVKNIKPEMVGEDFAQYGRVGSRVSLP